ncbi:hypothetical protein SARC_01483 [Sphaeroforma arctica JP610]|uniref:Uncharacterized protein n=1 Tax=Sphaeroforma arctica JP610 TaxID=667725 RepID=A0A0L0GDQ0_9EUKA|nr:hypothetical protein SARC_01483 [Sphaeroforma arctica JP610]KNC86388.1 hypothetical protein SARC_01483 [Sphaeroforma arctica JP610]|eukprot:XP_014160290.1 hypothetical protein SARC_01483 [Sphaeroforma arctica JP610]
MTRHLERFRLTGRSYNVTWASSTKTDDETTAKAEEQPTQKNISKAQKRHEQDQEDQITKTNDPPEEADK